MTRNFAFRVVREKIFSSTFFFVMVGMSAFSENGNNSLTRIQALFRWVWLGDVDFNNWTNSTAAFAHRLV